MISTNIAKPYSRRIRSQEELEKENTRLSDCIVGWKNKINNQKKWDIAKKYTNEYEFIFSFNNEGVSKVSPISRSFFKLVEILTDHRVLDRWERLNVAALCEGPGGFIQGVDFMCGSRTKRLESIYGITLRSTDKRIPDWKIKASERVRLLDGADGTGDLYSVENIDSFLRHTGLGSCELVTGDGGFDFSSDFNSQENDFLRLLLSEIYTGMRAQKRGGCFVIKMFDLFRSETIRLIAVLCECYQEVYIHKPRTSRPANSERYIVCLDFLGVAPEILRALRAMVIEKRTECEQLTSTTRYINTMNHVLDANLCYVNTQITYIQKTLRIIQDHAIFDKKRYEDQCVQWCRLYNIPVKSERE